MERPVQHRLGRVHPQARDGTEAGEADGHAEERRRSGDPGEGEAVVHQAERGRQQEQRCQVEQVAVAHDVRAPEAHVVRRRLEREQRQGQRGEGGERAASAIGVTEARVRPACSEEERYDAETDGEDVEVDRGRLQGDQGEQRALRRRHPVVAEQTVALAERGERDDDEDRHRVGDGERPMPPPGAAWAVRDQRRDGQDRGEEEELRPREEREREGSDRKGVAARRRLRDRGVTREHRPQEHRVRRGLGHDERRVDAPRYGHGEQRHDERARSSRQTAGEQVRRDRGAREQHGVDDVRGAERAGRVERTVER